MLLQAWGLMRMTQRASARRTSKSRISTGRLTCSRPSARAEWLDSIDRMRRAILYANPLRQQLPMVRRISKKQLTRLGALEIQVGVVIPGEADTTVDLNILGSCKEVRIRAGCFGEARDYGNFV